MEQIKVKSSWEELTVGEFVQLEQILKSDIPESYRTANVLSLLSGKTLEEIEGLPITEFQSLSKCLSFIETKPEANKISDIYTLNSRKYKLEAEVGKIITAQYIDYQNYSKEQPVDITKILSCWLVPLDHNYNDGYNMNQVISDIETMKLVDALAVSFFFPKQLAAYMLILKDCLQKNLKELKMDKKKSQELLTHLNNTAYSLWSLEFARL